MMSYFHLYIPKRGKFIEVKNGRVYFEYDGVVLFITLRM